VARTLAAVRMDRHGGGAEARTGNGGCRCAAVLRFGNRVGVQTRKIPAQAELGRGTLKSKMNA
jgi:hypothetical protein